MEDLTTYKMLLDQALDRCTTGFQAAWYKCDHLARFEAWADLYYARYGRLSPGKSAPPKCERDSNDQENRAWYEAWHKSGLAAHDAIMRVVALEGRCERYAGEKEDADDFLTAIRSALSLPPDATTEAVLAAIQAGREAMEAKL